MLTPTMINSGPKIVTKLYFYFTPNYVFRVHFWVLFSFLHRLCATNKALSSRLLLEQMDQYTCGNICKLKWRFFHLLDFPLVLWL